MTVISTPLFKRPNAGSRPQARRCAGARTRSSHSHSQLADRVDHGGSTGYRAIARVSSSPWYTYPAAPRAGADSLARALAAILKRSACRSSRCRAASRRWRRCRLPAPKRLIQGRCERRRRGSWGRKVQSHRPTSACFSGTVAPFQSHPKPKRASTRIFPGRKVAR